MPSSTIEISLKMEARFALSSGMMRARHASCRERACAIGFS